MYVVGLTGGIGAGKSEAAKMFAALNVPIVDVDVISHHLTEVGQPSLQKIADAFGNDILTADGALDRSALREQVFSSDAARRKLEAILHPAIHAAAVRQLSSNSAAPYQILAIPLLFETDRYRGLVNRTLLIDCAESLQISRTLQRNGMTEATVRAIIAAQASRSFRKALANDVIDNSGSIEQLQEQVAFLHKKYLAACLESE